MTDKEIEQENIKKRAIVDQAFNDWYINDIKRCFSNLRVCSVYFTDILGSKFIIELRNKHNVDIDGNDCVIPSIIYDMRNGNKEQISVFYMPSNGKGFVKHKTFEIGKPTAYLDLLETAVELLKAFSNNYFPRIIYDCVGEVEN